MSNSWPRAVRPVLDSHVSYLGALADDKCVCKIFIRPRPDEKWTGSLFTRELLKKYGLYNDKYAMLIPPYLWEQKANLRFLERKLPSVDIQIFEKTKKMFYSIMSCVQPVDCLTPAEAISLLPRKTHPGYPWCSLYRTKEGVVKSCSDFLYTALDFNWRGPTAMLTARKCEVRSAEKISEQKCRTIGMMDVLNIAIGIRLFFHLFEAIKQVADYTWMYVGKGRYYGATHRLMMRLKKYCISLDFTAMDSSVDRQILDAFQEWCMKLLPKECHGKVIEYFAAILTSVLVDSMGYVHLRDGGNATGHFGTTYFNTFYAVFCILYILFLSGFTVEQVRELFTVLASGDDVLITSDDPKLLESVLFELGAVHCGITLRVGKVVPTEQCDFLGDKYIFISTIGMWMPVPKDLERMYVAFADHCKKESPLMNYIRAYNFHVLCYWDDKFRAVTAEALRLLSPDPTDPFNLVRVKYSDKLVFQDQEITGEVVKTLSVSPIEILQLYTGWQSTTKSWETTLPLLHSAFPNTQFRVMETTVAPARMCCLVKNRLMTWTEPSISMILDILNEIIDVQIEP